MDGLRTTSPLKKTGEKTYSTWAENSEGSTSTIHPGDDLPPSSDWSLDLVLPGWVPSKIRRHLGYNVFLLPLH